MPILTRAEGTEAADLHLSRRALGGLMFAGYAAAALAAHAEPVHTDEAGLIAGTVSIPDGGQALPAYVARPDAPGRHGAVIVVNEVFGIHEYIRDICRRFAKLGYVAVAPQFFFREDPGNQLPAQTDFAKIHDTVFKASNAQVMRDVGATLQWLEHQPFAAARRIGITGFCWGGGVVWMACATYPELKAGVAWYGPLAHPKQPNPNDPDRPYPIEVAGRLKAPVLGLYGGKDQGISHEDIAAMQAALKREGKTSSEIVVYPEAQHGFHADYRASYDPTAAKDGWARLLAFFKAHGVVA